MKKCCCPEFALFDELVTSAGYDADNGNFIWAHNKGNAIPTSRRTILRDGIRDTWWVVAPNGSVSSMTGVYPSDVPGPVTLKPIEWHYNTDGQVYSTIRISGGNVGIYKVTDTAGPELVTDTGINASFVDYFPRSPRQIAIVDSSVSTSKVTRFFPSTQELGWQGFSNALISDDGNWVYRGTSSDPSSGKWISSFNGDNTEITATGLPRGTLSHVTNDGAIVSRATVTGIDRVCILPPPYGSGDEILVSVPTVTDAIRDINGSDFLWMGGSDFKRISPDGTIVYSSSWSNGSGNRAQNHGTFWTNLTGAGGNQCWLIKFDISDGSETWSRKMEEGSSVGIWTDVVTQRFYNQVDNQIVITANSGSIPINNAVTQ